MAKRLTFRNRCAIALRLQSDAKSKEFLASWRESPHNDAKMKRSIKQTRREARQLRRLAQAAEDGAERDLSGL